MSDTGKHFRLGPGGGQTDETQLTLHLLGKFGGRSGSSDPPPPWTGQETAGGSPG